MDQDGPEHPLQGKDTYLNGCHSPCMSLKTIALFVYHPAMWCILRLTTMKVKNEFSCEITLFWELFNEVMSDTKGRDYKFNPKAIMANENGANFCGIQMVFGGNFITPKVVSCQMHYRNDINRVSRIGPSNRDIFKSICHGMCCIATLAEYNKQKKWLEEIANIFPDISWCITWWDARKYHMLPAFRCFGYSNITLAKSGRTSLKCHTKLWLLAPAWDDMSTMLTQMNEFHSFLAKATSSSGKGPCSLTYNKAKRVTQICTPKAYTTKFSKKHAQHEAIEENTNPQVFDHLVVPGTGLWRLRQV